MKKIRLLLIAALTIGAGAKAQNVEPFKAGDRVVFLGNSITDGGHYHSNIWLYYMTHFPKMRITCVNAGVGGDRVNQMNDRFEDDVLTKHPTVLTVTWGMNDTGYMDWWKRKPQADSLWQVNFEFSRGHYAKLEQKLKQLHGVKVIYIGGSPYDEFTTSNSQNLYPGKSAAFQQVIDFQEAAAKRNNFGFVNFNGPMSAINKSMQVKDPGFSLTPNDRVHPDNDGHLVMAYLFLKTQGLTNKPVADVAINATDDKVSRSENALVSKLSATAQNVSYDYLAKSLPFPLDTIARTWGSHKKQSDATKEVPFMQELDMEKVTVNGLSDGNYQLSIDGQSIAKYTAQQLATGINLAEQTNTPQYQQAIQLMHLNEERWEIERRFRNYAYVEFNLLKAKGLLFADNKAAMDTLEKAAQKDIFMRGNKENYAKAQFKSVRDAWQKEMDMLVDEIYTLNKPQKHHIQLTLLK